MHTKPVAEHADAYLDWLNRLPIASITELHGGSSLITGSAKAVTPFGPLAGRTTVHVEDRGDDLAVISFMCGTTPVMLALSGDNFYGLLNELIAVAANDRQAELREQLREAIA